MTEHDVLYVEDDEQTRELGTEIIGAKVDAEVISAENPEQALELYNGEPVVITDYLFNDEMTGVDLLQELREPEQYVLFTGYDKAFVEREADIPEYTEFLTKGGGYDSLVQLVEEGLTPSREVKNR